MKDEVKHIVIPASALQQMCVNVNSPSYYKCDVALPVPVSHRKAFVQWTVDTNLIHVLGFCSCNIVALLFLFLVESYFRSNRCPHGWNYIKTKIR